MNGLSQEDIAKEVGSFTIFLLSKYNIGGLCRGVRGVRVMRRPVERGCEYIACTHVSESFFQDYFGVVLLLFKDADNLQGIARGRRKC